MPTDHYAHRPTKLRQANKAHKGGKHASKRNIDKAAHGRVEKRAGVKETLGIASVKQQRIAHARQAKRQLLAKTNAARRQALGDMGPKVIAVIGMGPAADAAAVVQALLAQASHYTLTDSAHILGNAVTASFPTQKFRATLLSASAEDPVALLDVAKVADVVVLVVNVGQELEAVIDETGDRALSMLRAQGLPSCMGLIQGLPAVPPKHAANHRKYAQRFFQTELGEDVKTLEVEHADQVVRALATVVPKKIHWRANRPYMVAMGATTTPTENPDNVDLTVTGYLRGRPLNVQGLVHISGVGSFQMQHIAELQDFCPLRAPAGVSGPGHMIKAFSDAPANIVATADPDKQEELRCMVEFDPMAADQTWPTHEEMKAAAVERARGMAKSGAVAGGTTGKEYQAAWLDGEDDGDDEDGEGTDEDMDGEDDEDEDDDEDGDEDDEGVEETKGDVDDVSAHSEVGDDDGSQMSVDEADMEEPDDKRRREEDEQRQFPNEVDTPRDTPACERFARYRGLKSFRTTPWHVTESLPREYARVNQLRDYSRTQKRVYQQLSAVERELAVRQASKAIASDDTDMKAENEQPSVLDGCENDYVQAGKLVQIRIKNVPLAALAARSLTTVMVVTGLLKHENRLTVMHFLVKRHGGYQEPVKSKDILEFHVGHRRYLTAPIFSQNNRNSDKHKFNRYLMPDGFQVATTYAPLSFCPLPILIFKIDETGQRYLVATGSCMGADPTRIIVKQIVLSGYPIKVKRCTATVKYMFFRPDDIRYFKSVEIWTKHGRHGHIQEPLGTHGLMKCVFNKPVTNNDTVCMSLYKRVFPKLPDPDVDDIQL